MQYDVIAGGATRRCVPRSRKRAFPKGSVLERAPEEAGGNSRFTAGLMRIVYNGVDD